MLNLCFTYVHFGFRLWGENFFNIKTKKWAKQKDDDNKRSFCMYILDPIYKVSLLIFVLFILNIICSYDMFLYVKIVTASR